LRSKINGSTIEPHPEEWGERERSEISRHRFCDS
jgi:hypothetical protein